MLRQPLIDKGVVRSQQIEDVAVLANNAFKQHLRFGTEGLTQLMIEITKTVNARSYVRHCAQSQPLADEVVHQPSRAWIRNHSLHLLLEHGRILQTSLGRQIRTLRREAESLTPVKL